MAKYLNKCIFSLKIIFVSFKKFQNYPDGQSCFFVDGVPLCGEEGEKAREEQRKFIERMISQQVKIFVKLLSNSSHT